MDLHQLNVVLGWCSLVNLVLMTASWLILIKARAWAYGIHSQWFPISESQFNMAIYCFFGLYKVLVFVFNIVPWLATGFLLWF